MSDDGWQTYLERFHADTPGVTERMLLRSRADGADPYGWAADAVPAGGLLVDIGCGSAPLADHIDPDRYLGVDRSVAELELAVGRSVRVIRGDAAAVPVAADSTATVTCLMALMLTEPLDGVVREVERILRPDGRLIALLPGRWPGGVADALRWSGVLAALGERALRWPNPRVLERSTDWLGAGFTVVSDDSRTFYHPIDDHDDAAQFIASLYLPGVSVERQGRAVHVLERWVGRQIGVPLRRIVARARP